MGKQTLIALDTDHIKQYVFATDRLKDIRGASSKLDHLNRRVMKNVAKEFQAEEVYANGGSGMFLIEGDKDRAKEFGLRLQKEYTTATNGGASISFAVQELPNNLNAWKDETETTRRLMELLNMRLVAAKLQPGSHLALASHPLMRPCDSCGTNYAEDTDIVDTPNPTDQDKRYCASCREKRLEDNTVRTGIDDIIYERHHPGHKTSKARHSYIWKHILEKFLPVEYDIPPGTERPSDFNELQGIAGGKDYLGLIYADGNGMGKVMGDLQDLTERKQVAGIIDESVYEALSIAIKEHLKVIPANGQDRKHPMFPFDILMIGGDDIMVVTPAAVALDVALTIAKNFHDLTDQKMKEYDPKAKGFTLSVGVVLAPIKYPFGLLQDLAESTLKHAKKEAAKKPKPSQYGATSINFLVVAGSTSHDFGKVYKSLQNKHVRISGKRGDFEFYATLRPYTVEELDTMLKAIREGKRLSLGRTKLHQVREAVLRMNLTTSVGDALAVLRNWRSRQRDFVMQHVYTWGERYQNNHRTDEDPSSLFPRVTFPWFADGDKAYRTALLDFVELYDFVLLEGGNSDNED